MSTICPRCEITLAGAEPTCPECSYDLAAWRAAHPEPPLPPLPATNQELQAENKSKRGLVIGALVIVAIIGLLVFAANHKSKYERQIEDVENYIAQRSNMVSLNVDGIKIKRIIDPEIISGRACINPTRFSDGYYTDFGRIKVEQELRLPLVQFANSKNERFDITKTIVAKIRLDIVTQDGKSSFEY